MDQQLIHLAPSRLPCDEESLLDGSTCIEQGSIEHFCKLVLNDQFNPFKGRFVIMLSLNEMFFENILRFVCVVLALFFSVLVSHRNHQFSR